MLKGFEIHRLLAELVTMTKSLFIVFTALCFFMIQENKPRFQSWQKTSSIKTLFLGLPKPLNPESRLWVALISGERRVLKKEEKELFQRLGITHIFTPSGMHLSTLIVFFTKGKIFKSLALIIGILMGLFGFFPAMTRVLFLKTIPKGLPFFALVMMAEGVFFSWQRHDLSWICSWLFLGLCYFSPRSHRGLWFALGQMLLCHIFFQVWSPIGILINLFMMLLLQILFPPLLIASITNLLPPDSFLWILRLLFKILLSLDELHQYLTLFIPHLGHLIFFLLWIILAGKQRLVILPFILLLLSAPLNQNKRKPYSQSLWEGVSNSKMKCKNNWKNQRWEDHCRPLSRAAKELANLH